MDEDLDAVRERRKRTLMQEQGLGAPASPVYVDGSQSLDQTVTAHDVVLVHYYADGGAGQRLHPVVESVARETFAAVAKVNVVHHQKLALERGVEATPAFEVYADGERQERVRGQVGRDELVELVGEYTPF
ncbi:thioredoxin family protein [Halorussus gelatinilyticus]|uniref:Thioredoxin family protein n=1 Tax=Halorussus gelatinilyticus TaxID=2937524 RepID=A0A8U0IGD9_9EURY|nr:thioredoxin family protein [Halorussus gelatinilyticus]UPV99735.1 thioredoxin family protein [Halorussus gelatinilyticus]